MFERLFPLAQPRLGRKMNRVSAGKYKPFLCSTHWSSLHLYLRPGLLPQTGATSWRQKPCSQRHHKSVQEGSMSSLLLSHWRQCLGTGKVQHQWGPIQTLHEIFFKIETMFYFDNTNAFGCSKILRFTLNITYMQIIYHNHLYSQIVHVFNEIYIIYDAFTFKDTWITFIYYIFSPTRSLSFTLIQNSKIMCMCRYVH